ncbi:hypothetical protein J3R82DRAFT_2022 [Butyriboletus roseoflavus]|nr:hypothetical protein J3R82DRAFT_2022 [Butyriboletus roseoflavus]
MSLKASITAKYLARDATAPFNGTSDQNLAVAYIAVFTLVFFITLFPLGGANWVAMDFQGPDVVDEDVQERFTTNGAAIERFVISLKELFHLRRSQAVKSNYDDEKVAAPSELPIPSFDLDDEPPSPGTMIYPTHHRSGRDELEKRTRCSSSPPSHSICFQLRSNANYALFLSVFLISLVPILKALFVPADVPGVNMPPVPDGQPPLAIILNTATFIGNASVPLGLMNLGSALARLEVPGGRLRSLSFGPVGALAMGGWS